MEYLKNKLNVVCRTAEEEQIYREIADREGYKWEGGESLLEKRYYEEIPTSFQIGYWNSNEITYCNDLEYRMPEDFTTVEASVLFHNELISRRIQHGRT